MNYESEYGGWGMHAKSTLIIWMHPILSVPTVPTVPTQCANTLFITVIVGRSVIPSPHLRTLVDTFRVFD